MIKPVDTSVAGYKAARPRKCGQAVTSRRRLVALIFGLAAALGWHFLHQAGLPEEAAGSLHFWSHLVFEGFLALYAGSLSYIILALISRTRR